MPWAIFQRQSWSIPWWQRRSRIVIISSGWRTEWFAHRARFRPSHWHNSCSNHSQRICVRAMAKCREAGERLAAVRGNGSSRRGYNNSRVEKWRLFHQIRVYFLLFWLDGILKRKKINNYKKFAKVYQRRGEIQEQIPNTYKKIIKKNTYPLQSVFCELQKTKKKYHKTCMLFRNTCTKFKCNPEKHWLYALCLKVNIDTQNPPPEIKYHLQRSVTTFERLNIVEKTTSQKFMLKKGHFKNVKLHWYG